MLASPGRGKPYPMLPMISASTEAEPLWHTLHNWGRAQLEPDGVRASPSLRNPCGTAPRGARAVPACPTGLHMLPTAGGAAGDTGKGVGPAGISCYTSFLYLGFHQAPKHNRYKPLLFPHYRPSISYPTRSLRRAFSRASWLFVINMLIPCNTLDLLSHTHATKQNNNKSSRRNCTVTTYLYLRKLYLD